MEIFRHYYSKEEWATSVFFKKHINDFGFCNMTGDPVSMNWNTTTGDLAMRYKLDPKKQTYLYNQCIPDSSHSGPPTWRSSGLNVICRLSNGTYYKSGRNETYNSYTGQIPSTVVFLPLKNNGFLLNIRSLTNDTDAQCNPSTSNPRDARDTNFLIPTPTPDLVTKIYYAGSNTPTTNYSAGVLTFIGLPPCKGNNNWTYLLFTKNQHLDYNAGENTTYTNELIDFGDGKVYNMPFKSNFIRRYSGPTSYNELTYTDINNNVCSLVKMPYDTGYIDGLYLMTTSPQQLEDCTFFSFDGRNFLNVFENYVLELPSSSS